MHKRVAEALQILRDIGMPRAQLNERSALCLLAISNVTPRKAWSVADAPLIGTTPIMEFAAEHYRDKPYAPNTRETIRRQSMHQFCDAGVARPNPDDPARPTNSPNWVYQITPEALPLVRAFGSQTWGEALALFREQSKGLAERYASAREMELVPLKISTGERIVLSPGEHSELIRQIVEVFGAHYAP